MLTEEALQIADKALVAKTGKALTDIQHMILRESLADKGYEQMQGYDPQHIKNEGSKLWILLSEALNEKVSKKNFRGALERRLKSINHDLDWQERCRDEETKYLRSITEKFQIWWKRCAFMDEIDESTWFEFGLQVKMPKPKREENPSHAGYEDKEDSVPILETLNSASNEPVLIVGKPGAGKSTFLAQALLKAAEKALQDSTAPIPVRIELKSYGQQSNIKQLIKAAFEEYDFLLGMPEAEKLSYIENLIGDKRLFLLADGVNELPEEKARIELKAFCNRNLPMIFTTRDISAGNLGIQKKLEIQPLSSGEVEQFLRDRLPSRDQNRVKELCDRVRDFGQTPLMVWMLYSVFKQKDTIPATRGEAYREFTTIYAERAKEGIDLEQSRSLLSKLAFEMMQSQKPKDFRLEIFEREAKKLLGGERYLKLLLNNLLLQQEGKPGSRKIRFCHQSLQEYYAAEYLLDILPKLLNDDKFKLDYLNYLKWTEPIALMLMLPELTDQNIARVIAQEVKNLKSQDIEFISNLYKDIDKVVYQIQENPELRQNDREDRLTVEIVTHLCNLGYDASHDSKIGGHVDIAVRRNDFLWLGEAKIYKDNNCLWEGFQQLNTRYSIGDSNQNNGGLLIYIFEENANSIMRKWQDYLQNKNLPGYSYIPCKMRSLAFISTHRHERSGQAFHAKHIPVMLYFSPKDRNGRRKK